MEDDRILFGIRCLRWFLLPTIFAICIIVALIWNLIVITFMEESETVMIAEQNQYQEKVVEGQLLKMTDPVMQLIMRADND